MTIEPRDPALRLVPDRRRRTAGAALVVVIVGLVVAVVVAAVGAASSSPRPVAPAATPDGAAFSMDAREEPPVLVHVLGEVRTPGLFELRSDARVLDAVAAAGGLTDAADPGAINLARRVADGEQLVVPAVGADPVGGGQGAGGTTSNGLVSLTNATVDELEELPRIGPAIAERIVAWREAGGRFTSVDDLLEVEGIGPKIVEALRDRVVP